jgi:hypothetical protein
MKDITKKAKKECKYSAAWMKVFRGWMEGYPQRGKRKQWAKSNFSPVLGVARSYGVGVVPLFSLLFINLLRFLVAIAAAEEVFDLASPK